VGKTTTWDWPSDTNLSLWDSYYQSYGYTRSGADANNAAIALWMHEGIFKHASVRKNSTIQNPHGFEWESKCGHLERVMHTRDALVGSSYGSIIYYYRPISGTVNYGINEENGISTRSSTAMQQSIFNLDLSNESRFTQSDLIRIAVLKDHIPANITATFDTKYLAWEKTWSKPEIAIYSNPYKYAESSEYKDLLMYCAKYGKSVWPLFIDKLAQTNIFVVNLLRDLTYGGNINFIDDITPPYDGVVSKPVPSLYSNLVDYTKKILTNEQDNIIKSIQVLFDLENEPFEVSVAMTNGQKKLLNIYSKVEGIANVKVYNFFGDLEHEANHNVLKNNQTVIDVSSFKKGVYVIQITVGSKTISQKISL
jgi:hypothetical protein